MNDETRAKLIERIKSLIPGVSSLEHWQETAQTGEGKEYDGELCPPNEIQYLIDIVSQTARLSAALEKAEADRDAAAESPRQSPRIL